MPSDQLFQQSCLVDLFECNDLVLPEWRGEQQLPLPVPLDCALWFRTGIGSSMSAQQQLLYQEHLAAEGLGRKIYSLKVGSELVERTNQVCPPVALPSSLIDLLHSAHQGYIAGIQATFSDRENLCRAISASCPLFKGRKIYGETLIDARVNSFAAGCVPQTSFDCMVVQLGNVIGLSLIEAQIGPTLLSLPLVHLKHLKGNSRDEPVVFHRGGVDRPVSEEEFYRAVEAFCSSYDQVHIIDCNPLASFNTGDLQFQAKLFGGDRARPLNLAKVRRSGDAWVFPQEEVLPDGEITLLENEVTRVGCNDALFIRSTPDELTELFTSVTDEQGHLIVEFLSDCRLNFCLHPIDLSLSHKGSLLKVRDHLKSIGHPSATLYGSLFGEGEVLPRGRYAVKRINGNSGNGQSTISVDEPFRGEFPQDFTDESYDFGYSVPKNHIAQRLFDPAPMFCHGDQLFHNFELRSSTALGTYRDEEPMMTVVVRHGPRYERDVNGRLKICRTNRNAIMRASEMVALTRTDLPLENLDLFCLTQTGGITSGFLRKEDDSPLTEVRLPGISDGKS